MSSKRVILRLYRDLLLESNKFPYNFREYTSRVVKEDFRKFKNVSNQKEIDTLLQKGNKELDLIKRQTIVSNLYKHQKNIVEE